MSFTNSNWYVNIFSTIFSILCIILRIYIHDPKDFPETEKRMRIKKTQSLILLGILTVLIKNSENRKRKKKKESTALVHLPSPCPAFESLHRLNQFLDFYRKEWEAAQIRKLLPALPYKPIDYAKILEEKKLQERRMSCKDIIEEARRVKQMIIQKGQRKLKMLKKKKT